MRRFLLGAAMIVAAFAGLDCEVIFRPQGSPTSASRFAGCFRGPITEPAGLGGQLTIVLEPASGTTDGLSLAGCATATEPRFDASLAGTVLDDRTQARLIAMPQARPSFVLRVDRQPPDDDATTVTVVNESSMPFDAAADLPRCAAQTTCADLGIVLPFTPGGAP